MKHPLNIQQKTTRKLIRVPSRMMMTSKPITSLLLPPVDSTAARSRSPEWTQLSRLLRHRHNLPLRQLKTVHGRMFRLELHDDEVLAAMLVFSSPLSLPTSYSLRLLRSLPTPDLPLLNAVLRSLSRRSHHLPALRFLLHSILPLHPPDRFTLLPALRSAAAIPLPSLALQLHVLLLKRPDLHRDPRLLNSLLRAYLRCRLPDHAHRILASIPSPDVDTSNVLLAALDLPNALALFHAMPRRDQVSWNTMLARVPDMRAAQELFDAMPRRNLVSWNSLVSGYARAGRGDEAIAIFARMLAERLEPDESTILSLASACESAGALDDALVEKIAGFARRLGGLCASTALLAVYCRAGRTADAREVFDGLPERDLAAWNAMIGGYARNGRAAEAVELFRAMQEDEAGADPDGITLASLLDACSQMGALELGGWAHAYAKKRGIAVDTCLATALVDMYAKCGDLDRARAVFSSVAARDLPCWNAMIKGLAVHGRGEEAMEVFAEMQRAGVAPNESTFAGLLSACSHGGLVERGLETFEAMREGRYGVSPRIAHYGCVVDLLGRAGRLAEARALVTGMPMEPDAAIWCALLAAARFHRDVGLAEEAARRLLELDPAHDGNYVLLANTYASVGRWEGADEIRARMRSNEVAKEPGCSAVELEGAMHEFTAGDRSHPRSAEIYATWEALAGVLKQIGYRPDTSAVTRNLREEDKEAALSRHSEKLALSLALISNSPGTIRIVKNLRICTDCHRVMELVSRIKNRDIVVRDRSRFHHFSQGTCSCGGYW